MSKKIKNTNINNTSVSELEEISIEELDLEMNEFYIDYEKIDSIKAPNDMKSWVRDAIDKAEVDINKHKRKTQIIASAASIAIVFSIGVYNPVLAHKVPFLEKILKTINDTLKIDEISASLEIDTIIPKAVVENNKIHFVKITRYKVDKTKENKESKDDNKGSDNKENNNEGSNGKNIVYDEYGVVNFIHQMSNQIINPADGKKFGVIKITPQNIEIALNSIKNINNDEARDYLNKALRKWQNGDFNNAVEVHNYVWHMLGGEIGIASSLDEEEINKIKAQYFK